MSLVSFLFHIFITDFILIFYMRTDCKVSALLLYLVFLKIAILASRKDLVLWRSGFFLAIPHYRERVGYYPVHCALGERVKVFVRPPHELGLESVARFAVVLIHAQVQLHGQI